MRKLIAVLAVVTLLLAGVADARQAGERTAVVSALDLVDTSYTYYAKGVGGTAATDGWIAVSGSEQVFALVTWTTKAAASLDYSVKCKAGPQVAIIRQSSLTAVGTDTVALLGHGFDFCRVGLKLTTDSGTNDVTASITTSYSEK